MDISPEEQRQVCEKLAQRFRDENEAPTELTQEVERKFNSALKLVLEKKPENFSASLELKIILYLTYIA